MEFVIENIEIFLSKLPSKSNFDGNPIFRGQEKDYPLVPSLFREGHIVDCFGGWDPYEQQLLDKFKKKSLPLIMNRPTTDFEWLILAQHHGLPSRVLDWTDNPLIALFFAVENLEIVSDAVVWSFFPSARRFIPFGTWKELNEITEVESFYPPHLSPRMTAQQACITIHPLPAGKENFKPFETWFKGKVDLTKYIIPNEKKQEIKLELDRIGISYSSIYPDLDGIARTLKWDIRRQHILGRLTTKRGMFFRTD